ncbi:hypothetical protein EZI54_13060 [Marinobacter halodurans]|uniref:JmjC domain-containing protein n=1 Tax=Marinobacter halodurans TaxID=2528979 RepID=A0ABY1ZJB7_9GAMM|nr:cupin-like domain-containing protein [Marinobacter halodurans]TBW54792.1 hypothetical protein EZI54_13060 [Marinobacter halodurans]
MSNRTASVVRKIETAAHDVWEVISDTRCPETWIPFLDSRRLSSDREEQPVENGVLLYHPSSHAIACDNLIAFSVVRLAPDDRTIEFNLTSGFLQISVEVIVHEAAFGALLEVGSQPNVPPQYLSPAFKEMLQGVSKEIADTVSVICRAKYPVSTGKVSPPPPPSFLSSRHPEMSVTGVERVAPTSELKDIMAAGCPVIFGHYGGSTSAYPLLQDLDWWNDRFGDQTVRIQEMEKAAYMPENTYVSTTISMLVSMLASNPNGSRFALYETSVLEILGLGQYLPVPEMVPREYPVKCHNIWIGAPHINSTLHQDGHIVDRTGKDPKKYHNLNFQIAGRKHFILAHPNQTKHLYPMHRDMYNDGAPTSQVDPFGPLDFGTFPEVKKAELFEGVLEPGEMLYVPRGWWHAFYSLENTINSNTLFSSHDF